MMGRVNNCCFFFDLERGGNIWAVISMIVGVVWSVKFIFDAFSAFKYGVVAGIFFLYFACLAFATVCVSALIMMGIHEKRYQSILPARMLALKIYSVAIFFAVYILLSDYCETKIVIDYSKDGKSHELTADKKELLAYKSQIDFLKYILLFIALDYFFRFRVIESLYQYYKEQGESEPECTRTDDDEKTDIDADQTAIDIDMKAIEYNVPIEEKAAVEEKVQITDKKSNDQV